MLKFLLWKSFLLRAEIACWASCQTYWVGLALVLCGLQTLKGQLAKKNLPMLPKQKQKHCCPAGASKSAAHTVN
jgi:hypothetical protein